MMRPRAAAAFCSVLATLTALVVPVSAAEAAVPSQEQWAADVNQAMAGSRVYLRQRVAQGGTRLAVNLDIDNTSLASHYAYGQAVSVVLRFADYAPGEAAGIRARYGAAFAAALRTGRLEAASEGAVRIAPRHRFVADDVIAWIESRAEAGESLESAPGPAVPAPAAAGRG